MGEVSRPRKAVFTLDEIEQNERQRQAAVVLKSNPEIDRMTEKQRALALEMAANPDKTFKQQCRDAGYKISPTANSEKNIKRVIGGKLSQTLADAGIYEMDIGRAMWEGLHACTVSRMKVAIRDKDGKITGEEIKEFIDPDFHTRGFYMKAAIILGGYNPPKQLSVSGSIKHEQSSQIVNLLCLLTPEQLERNIRAMKEEGIDADFEEIAQDQEGQKCLQS